MNYSTASLVLVLGLGFGVATIAQEGSSTDQSRQIIGGDLIYSAEASAATETEALFLAEQQAVRMIVIECSIPHRQTRIFHQSTVKTSNRYLAQVQAGLPLADCEESKAATAERKKELTNPTLAESQRSYQRKLENEPAPVAPSQSVAKREEIALPDLRLPDSSLERRVDQREAERRRVLAGRINQL